MTTTATAPTCARPLSELGREDIALAGGKGANLGELLHAGMPVPNGFVITTEAYTRTLQGAAGEPIRRALSRLDVNDTTALQSVARSLHDQVIQVMLPDDVRNAITDAYHSLAENAHVAVRSSATAEDTPRFSFAGMFESFLNVQGEAAVLDAVRRCWASTFGARVLFYRVTQGMPAEMPVAVIVQEMIDADAAGVLFTVDPATHDRSRMVIEAAWGLGEVVVAGQLTPDHYILDKGSLALIDQRIARKEFMLTRAAQGASTVRVDLRGDPRLDAAVLQTDQLRQLGDLGRRIEQHYGTPQDIEFAIANGTVYITQSRPITTLKERAPAEPAAARELVRGLGASPGVATGIARIVSSIAEAARLEPKNVLVTTMTAPDWVPVMRRAAAIVTDAGGMTSHAAIVARELGVPCVVGARNATRTIEEGALITVNGSDGTVTAGEALSDDAGVTAPAEAQARSITATRLYVNLAEPGRAAEIAARDVDGVGLLRAEFMMLEALEGKHPRRFIEEGKQDDFVERMATQLAQFAQAFAPRPVIYRAMDFRSNEFRALTGGSELEPQEANPMIGYRGCFRYGQEPDLFALELRALHQARTQSPNLHLMIPFVRNGPDFERCKELIDQSELGGARNLELWIMAEVPSVISWLETYARLGVRGVSIGSNDLTQLILGVDRDSTLLAPLYDERDRAVLAAIRAIIDESHRLGLTCSICGQAPSIYPDYAKMLVRWGIDSISVNPDVIESARANIAAAEQAILLDAARSTC